MSSIVILTDTDASLPAAVAEKHGIQQVPIMVLFGEEELETGIGINDAQLFARIDREGRLPTTSAPAPGQFAQAYQAAFEGGADSIICFCVSGEVSATLGADNRIGPGNGQRPGHRTNGGRPCRLPR